VNGKAVVRPGNFEGLLKLQRKKLMSKGREARKSKKPEPKASPVGPRKSSLLKKGRPVTKPSRAVITGRLSERSTWEHQPKAPSAFELILHQAISGEITKTFPNHPNNAGESTVTYGALRHQKKTHGEIRPASSSANPRPTKR